MNRQPPADSALMFKNPFQWEVFTVCRNGIYALDPEIIEAFSRAAVSYSANRRFLWLVPISRQHCLVNFDFPLEIDDPLFRQQKIPHAGRFIHQLDVRAMETLNRAIGMNYLKLALAAGRGGAHGKA